jgi:hypothetical protein
MIEFLVFRANERLLFSISTRLRLVNRVKNAVKSSCWLKGFHRTANHLSTGCIG